MLDNFEKVIDDEGKILVKSFNHINKLGLNVAYVAANA